MASPMGRDIRAVIAGLAIPPAQAAARPGAATGRLPATPQRDRWQDLMEATIQETMMKSLLQKTLDQIEDDAARLSQAACCHAGRIAEMEALINTLNAHGAKISEQIPIIYQHIPPDRDEAVNTTIRIWSRHAEVRDALYSAGLRFHERAGEWAGKKPTFLAIDGLDTEIAMIDEPDYRTSEMFAAKEAA